RADGSLWAWGDLVAADTSGIAEPDSDMPLPFNVGETWKSVAASKYVSCALKHNGEVYCAGETEAALGLTPSSSLGDWLIPLTLATPFTDWDLIVGRARGNGLFCGLRNGGKSWCW